jgi:hypothetical protein
MFSLAFLFFSFQGWIYVFCVGARIYCMLRRNVDLVEMVGNVQLNYMNDISSFFWIEMTSLHHTAEDSSVESIHILFQKA